MSLGDVQRTTPWTWAYCERQSCGRGVPLAIAPYVIRWGADASSDLLRKNLTCEKCGWRGASLKHPSWKGTQIGFQPFPVERMSF